MDGTKWSWPNNQAVLDISLCVAGLDGGVCYDDEQMAKPIKKFIADYVRKQVGSCEQTQ